MEGGQTTTSLPPLAFGRVESYDPVNHQLIVRMPSMQEIGVSVKMLQIGAADACRVQQEPLPIAGTWGLVAFPSGDSRAAIWLGAIFQSAVDALTTSDPPTNQDTQIKYMSHFSGAYSILDQAGNYYWRSPEGTEVTINVDNAPPVVRRHVLTAGIGTPGTSAPIGTQQRVLVPFTDAQRVNPVPADPYYVSVRHPTGSSITITPLGEVLITSPNPQDIPNGTLQSSQTFTPSGVISLQTGGLQDTPSSGPVLELNPLSSGEIAPQTTPPGGAQIIGQDGMSDIFLDKDGNILISSNGSTTTVQLTSSGDITITGTTAVQIAANGDITTQSVTGSITLQTALSSIVVDASGAISITGALGNIDISPVGAISITSAISIALTAPPNTITANGNILG